MIAALTSGLAGERAFPVRLDPKQIEVPDALMVEVLRQKSPRERLRIGFDMWVSAHNMLLTHIRHSHPDWSQTEVEHEVARRMSHGAV